MKYSVVLDAGVQMTPVEFKKFKQDVAIYLSDPDGWARTHIFEEVPKGGDVVIHLSSPEDIRKAGCPDPNLSCAELGGKHLRLNSMRWFRGAKESGLPLEEYRQYMVSHEMGHILGHDHSKCTHPGSPAPIMMQQTIGIGKCNPNTKVFSR
jgi:hypothetical protein